MNKNFAKNTNARGLPGGGGMLKLRFDWYIIQNFLQLLIVNLLSVLNLVLIVSTLLLMLKLFFKTPGASNPSSHTRTDSTDHNYPSSNCESQ